MKHPETIYGLMAEFATPEQLLEAAQHTHDAGYRRIDAFAPFPIEGLAQAVGFHRTRLPLIVLLAGIFGGASGFFLQYYAAAISYPINVGGRPLNSWPAFIPVTFELTILFAAGRGCLRHAGDERTADALSSGFQRAAFCAGFARPIFSLHQGARSDVRSGDDPEIHGVAEPARGRRN